MRKLKYCEDIRYFMDEVDVQILKLLWEDGRMPIYSIANRVGLSNAGVNKRIVAMKKRGELLGFSILLNPARVMKAATVSIRARKRRSEVWEAVEKIKGVMHFVACLGGRYYGDFWYRDEMELEEKLTLLKELTSAYRVDLYYYYKKDNARIAKMDWKIIKELSEDGRIPFTELSKKLGVSTKTLSKRWKRLMENEICKVYPIVNRPLTRDLFWFSLFMEVENLNVEGKIKKIENLWRTSIFEKPKMIYGVFYAKTVKQIDDTIERIWNFPEMKKIYYEIIVEERFYPHYIDYVRYKYES